MTAAPMSNGTYSKFGTTSHKVSRPMTAFYSNAGTVRSGTGGGFIRNNAPLSNATFANTVTTAFHQKQQATVAVLSSQ